MGSMLFTIVAALGQMEHEIKRERVTDSIAKRREAGKDLGGRPAGSLTARFEALSAWSKAASPQLRSHVISDCPEQPL
jgi:DNA invertase Pin-like site-specific DNA recombinase